MAWAGSAITGSGLPAPNGPAAASVATISTVTARAVNAPSTSRASSRRAASTSAPRCCSRKARNSPSAPVLRVTPAAMACPPPFISTPSATAGRRPAGGFRPRDSGKLARMASTIGLTKLGRERCGGRGIGAKKQLGAEIGSPDTPACIDARPQHEAEMPRLRRPAKPRYVHQRRQADALASAHRDQPLGHEGAIEPLERDHVRNGAERNEVKERHQVRLRPRLSPEAAPAQLAADRYHGEKNEPDRRQMAEPRQLVAPVRVDHRHRDGK